MTKHIADAESTFIVVNVTPDFCKVGKKIVPFDIFQQLAPEKNAYSTNVFARGKKVLLLDSVIKGVIGNAGEGVQSNVSQGAGHTRVIEGAKTVVTQGRLTARHLDEVLMNGAF